MWKAAVCSQFIVNSIQEDENQLEKYTFRCYISYWVFVEAVSGFNGAFETVWLAT